jgi:ABC-2 type transport system ATP-binding protein
VPNIKLEDVSIEYPIYDARNFSWRNSLLTKMRLSSFNKIPAVNHVRALNNIDLEIVKGGRVGLIGGNGAGKTTLLKTLAGIYSPTTGKIAKNGTVSALLGSNFNMDGEFTGYENILLSGITMGQSIQQMKAKFEEIAEFTELGECLNMPMRTYSSGMRARLVFAIMTSVVPDILIIDEGIGVTDAAFMAKAQKKIEDFFASSGILVIASHVESVIRDFCKTVLVMKDGSIVYSGAPEESFAYYNEMIRR